MRWLTLIRFIKYTKERWVQKNSNFTIDILSMYGSTDNLIIYIIKCFTKFKKKLNGLQNRNEQDRHWIH